MGRTAHVRAPNNDPPSLGELRAQVPTLRRGWGGTFTEAGSAVALPTAMPLMQALGCCERGQLSAGHFVLQPLPGAWRNIARATFCS